MMMVMMVMMIVMMNNSPSFNSLVAIDALDSPA
jgi:hypothetical protein